MGLEARQPQPNNLPEKNERIESAKGYEPYFDQLNLQS